MNMDDSAREFLLELLDTPSPSGFEARGQKLWVDHVRNWADVTPAFDAKKMVMAPFCGQGACEEAIKERSAKDTTIENAAGAAGMRERVTYDSSRTKSIQCKHCGGTTNLKQACWELWVDIQ